MSTLAASAAAHTPDAHIEADIAAAVRALRGDTVSMLSELVALPSLLGEEAAAQNWMADRMGGMGLRVDRFDIDEAKLRQHRGWSPSLISYDGRPNVVGVHQPSAVKGRSLILNGHIDVVPVGNASMWASPPFAPRVDGDRLYGRGAADMKAGIIAWLNAFVRCKHWGWSRRPRSICNRSSRKSAPATVRWPVWCRAITPMPPSSPSRAKVCCGRNWA